MKVIATDGAPKAIGPYSQAVMAAGRDMLFLSGQIGLDPLSGAMVRGGVEAETRQVLANIDAVLAAAGFNRNDVVKTTIFLQNLDDFQRVNALYGEFFGDHRPARSTVQVSALPRAALIEMEAIAIKTIEERDYEYAKSLAMNT